MKNIKILIFAVLICAGFAFDANAQIKRKKRTPVRRQSTVRQLPPNVIEAEVISLGADELGNQNSNGNPTNAQTSTVNPTAGTNRTRTANAANAAQTASQTDKDDAGLRDLDRLTQAEERAENLRRQLSDSTDRESTLKARLDELDFQLRPENIQRETAVIGSLRPEELRDSRRRLLENEKARVNEQITRTLESRAKLETAIASFDDLIGKLRTRVQASTESSTKAANPANQPSEEIRTRPDNPPQQQL